MNTGWRGRILYPWYANAAHSIYWTSSNRLWRKSYRSIRSVARNRSWVLDRGNLVDLKWKSGDDASTTFRFQCLKRRVANTFRVLAGTRRTCLLSDASWSSWIIPASSTRLRRFSRSSDSRLQCRCRIRYSTHAANVDSKRTSLSSTARSRIQSSIPCDRSNCSQSVNHRP